MSRYHKLRIKDIHKETSDSVVIEFEVPQELKESFSFKPGQHIGVKSDIKGEDVRRSYSICSVPDDEALKIGVKHVEGGLFSTFANLGALPGDVLDIMVPQGNFTHSKANGKPGLYVFFAAGSGITPIISLITSILEEEPFSEVMLFYGNRSTDSIMFREELEDLKNAHTNRLSVHHVLSRERLNSPANEGRIDLEKCQTWSKVFFRPEEVDAFYICGPEEMIIAVRDWLQTQEVDEKKIHFELFTTPTSKAFVPKNTAPKREIDSDSESLVTVIIDGAATEFVLPYRGKSVLDAAMNNGADVPFSCKGGVCCTCKAKLVKGEVDMDVVYGLEPDEVAAGYILTCQSHPVTDKVLIDYDI